MREGGRTVGWRTRTTPSESSVHHSTKSEERMRESSRGDDQEQQSSRGKRLALSGRRRKDRSVRRSMDSKQSEKDGGARDRARRAGELRTYIYKWGTPSCRKRRGVKREDWQARRGSQEPDPTRKDRRLRTGRGNLEKWIDQTRRRRARGFSNAAHWRRTR